jgi:glucosylglycerate phosphorylase
MAELGMMGGFRHQVFQRYQNLLRIRRQQPAFSPAAGFSALSLGPQIFGLERTASGQKILVLTNITGETQQVSLPPDTPTGLFDDLLSEETFSSGRVDLRPYQTVWLTRR